MNGSPLLIQRADRFLGSLTARLPPPLNDPRMRLRFQAGAAIALAISFFVYLLLFSNLLAPLNRLATDFLYHPIAAQPDLAIIEIDKKSLDEIGPYPWPRAIHAALLDRLSAAPPRVVVFNLLFAQPSPNDPTFAAKIKENGAVILAATGVKAAAFPPVTDSVPSFDIVILPDTALREATQAIGHRMITPDSDGVVRRVATAIEANGVWYPALGLATAALALGAQVDYDIPARQVRVGNVLIPVDEHGNALLNFTSPNNGIPKYSYVDVFRGALPPETFRNKIVLIGGTSTIETEDYAIPLQLGDQRTYNVNLQADLANMILSTPPQTLQSQGALGQLALTLFVALLAGLTLPHLRPLYAVIVTLVFLLGLLLFAFEAFNRGVVIQILYPALALLLTAACIIAYRYLSEERRRQFLTALFRRYVPSESVPHVVDAIDRGELPLTGTRRMVTVLYADLRGSAALSEEIDAQAILRVVNQYMEFALQAVQREGGTVSKPMGDALIAIWNAPLDQPDHAVRGLTAAVQLRRNVMQWQQKHDADEKLAFGIGLVTGWAVLGNLNAAGKVEYTLVGDTVNVAARISAFANNNQILADTVTAQNQVDGIILRELSPVRVRGRKEPLPVWEVRDSEPLATEPDEET
ncbi:MAG: adenylate/guanylate cyclase domain-containing protein [Chloroflexota bacterium]|nr:MAG: adenylate/guanylate cyclase domain-containing protein [Chloroflexota bacterium]